MVFFVVSVDGIKRFWAVRSKMWWSCDSLYFISYFLSSCFSTVLFVRVLVLPFSDVMFFHICDAPLCLSVCQSTGVFAYKNTRRLNSVYKSVRLYVLDCSPRKSSVCSEQDRRCGVAGTVTVDASNTCQGYSALLYSGYEFPREYKMIQWMFERCDDARLPRRVGVKW